MARVPQVEHTRGVTRGGVHVHIGGQPDLVRTDPRLRESLGGCNRGHRLVEGKNDWADHREQLIRMLIAGWVLTLGES